jgi:hypothetical protein
MSDQRFLDGSPVPMGYMPSIERLIRAVSAIEERADADELDEWERQRWAAQSSDR